MNKTVLDVPCLRIKGKQVCAIIVTYNSSTGLLNVLNAIIGQVDYVVIIDNHSDIDTLKCLDSIKERFLDKVTVLLNEENIGLASALNQGVKFALDRNFEWILTLDHDSVAENEMVNKMLGKYNKHKEEENIGIIAPQSIDIYSGRYYGFIRNSENRSGNLNSDSESGIKEVDLIHTSGNLVKTSLFKTVGLFREDFFIDQVDYEFCFRLKKAGFKIIVVADAFLNHRLGNMKRAKFFNRQVICTNHSAVRRYYIARNRVVLFKEIKNWPFIKGQSVSILKEVIKVLLFEEDKWSKLAFTVKGIKDGIIGKLGKLEVSRRGAKIL